MPKYLIQFKGFAYIKAETPEQAEELFWNSAEEYREDEITSVKQITDKAFEEYEGGL